MRVLLRPYVCLFGFVSREIHDSKNSIAFIKDGTASIVKTPVCALLEIILGNLELPRTDFVFSLEKKLIFHPIIFNIKKSLGNPFETFGNQFNGFENQKIHTAESFDVDSGCDENIASNLR
jgi:hypothetical protein